MSALSNDVCTGQCLNGLGLDVRFDEHEPHKHEHAQSLKSALNVDLVQLLAQPVLVKIDMMSVQLSVYARAAGSLTFVATSLDDFDGDSGTCLGQLIVRATPWTILHIETHPMYVRQGVATTLYRYAISVLGQIVHSPNRTPHGEAWARVVGGPTPALSTPDYSVDGFDLWERYLMDNIDEPEAIEIVLEYFPDASDYLED